MRMKKMLAVLAAISMLASMGISAAAEDEAMTTTVTTTEEAVTTTATETTAATEATTVEEATATEETTAETTVAIEENEMLQAYGDKISFVLNGVTFSAALGSDESGTGIESPFYFVKIYSEDNTQLLSVGVADYCGDEGLTEEYIALSTYFSVTGDNEITITTHDGIATSYNYVNGQFVKVGETVTTTTTTTSTTTTTTTVTSGEIVVDGTELSRYAFSLNGINFTAVLFEEKWNGVSADLNYLLTIYKGSSATNLDSIIVNYKYDIGTESSSTDVKDYISVLNDTVTVSIHNGTTTSYIYDTAKNAFVEADSEQEKTFTIEIPTSYVTAVCGITGEPITESNYKNSMVVSVTDITSCTNGTASIVSNGSFVAGFTVKDAKPGMITITGTTGTFSSSDDPSINTSHGQCGAAGNPDTFTVTVTIDENGNIVTGGSSNDGKTDSGSTTSNKPSTSNTTGTPKTGDVATLPAVALGLTMTAAGVVAVLYKKRK